MKLNAQLKILSATEARCRELEMRNETLRNIIREGNIGHAIYVPFPDKNGLPRLIFNWFKARPLETVALVHSHWISLMIDGKQSFVCANCHSIFGQCAEDFKYCPDCAAMMDFEKGE